MTLPDPPAPAPSGAEPTPASLDLRRAPRDLMGGRYEITGLIGEGGMGTIWRARCVALDVDVAIKVLHSRHTDPIAAERLLREARTTAALAHPSVVRTLDFGLTESGEPFLVMELLKGDSLAAWMDERGRMPATEAVRLLLPIVSALAAAHENGVIHRDVKPENIIIVPTGSDTYLPKLIDFGIAKVTRVTEGKVLTQTGAVLGSLEYMSPEQAGGRDVSAQTDVWAVCVVLYELIAGRRPFDGPDLTSLVLALYVCNPTPTTELAAGDEELWAILSRGLRRRPEERWSGMAALGEALAGWAEKRGITDDAGGTALTYQWLPASRDTTGRTPRLTSAGDSPSSVRAWQRDVSGHGPLARYIPTVQAPPEALVFDAARGSRAPSAPPQPSPPRARRVNAAGVAAILVAAFCALGMLAMHSPGPEARPALVQAGALVLAGGAADETADTIPRPRADPVAADAADEAPAPTVAPIPTPSARASASTSTSTSTSMSMSTSASAPRRRRATSPYPPLPLPDQPSF